MNMKINNDEKIGLAVIAGIIVLAHAIPMICCMNKGPEKRFIQGGKEMLGAIPDMAKRCTMKIAKKVML